jgi:GDP-4-dehydro-6-deoxy-D-mannose reductase
MKILVTGGAGFVGGYLVTALRQEFGDDVAICLTSRSGEVSSSDLPVEPLDVTDAGAVTSAIRRFGPSHIVHLAGLAAVPAASANANIAWQVHLFGTLNLANAILECAPDCTLVFISSGQVYGSTARHGQLLTEQALLAPTNEYALTKAAADLALGSLAERGLRCVRLRPFNHTGPGQSEEFVIPSFAMQIARIEAKRQPPVIRVGNLEAERDFLDVRDVTAAYARVIACSATLPPGVIFNIASGLPCRIGDILDRLIKISGSKIAIEQDTSRLRAVDTPRFVGDSERARRALDWRPHYEFDETLRQILTSARIKVSNMVSNSSTGG